jgi:hypothetical protein
MVAFDSDAEIIKHYRVDKMADISITDQQRDGKEHFESLDMGTYAKKVFGMFSGEERSVRLKGRKPPGGGNSGQIRERRFHCTRWG